MADIIIDVENAANTTYSQPVPMIKNFGITGSGTSGDPYILRSLYDLELIGTTGYALSAYYKLGANIDASATADPGYNSGAGWLPIGSTSTPFTGDLDGNNKSISNLYINRGETDNVGLFSAGISNNARYPIVKDLSLLNCNITGRNNVAGITGQNGSNYTNITITGNITGNSYVGGIIGYHTRGMGYNQQSFLIDGCTVNATITSTGSFSGGIVGGTRTDYRVKGTIQNCNVNSTFNSYRHVGGIIGIFRYTTNPATYTAFYNNNVSGTINCTADYAGGHTSFSCGSFKNCTTTNLEINGTTWVGGVAGYLTINARVNDCSIDAEITGTDGVGGIGGATPSENSPLIIENCAFDGNITGVSNIGGIVGRHNMYYTSSKVSSCHVAGTINATGSNVGGICGNGVRLITGITVDTDLVINASTSSDNVGSILGYCGDQPVTITNCVSSINISGRDNIGGIMGSKSVSNHNCIISSCSYSGDVSGRTQVGLIAGSNGGYGGSSSIDGTGCTISGTVTGTGNSIGGVAGHSYKTVTKWNIGSDVIIEASPTTENVGGVVGYVGTQNGTITYCNVSTDVAGYKNVGGILGYSSANNVNLIINNCNYSGDISGETAVGGIVGNNAHYGGSVIDGSGCTIVGSITATGFAIGGVAGHSYNTIQNWSLDNNLGITVSSTSDSVGGISGQCGGQPGSIINCSVSSIDINGRDKVGGILGEATLDGDFMKISLCKYRGNISGNNYVGGIVGYGRHYSADGYIKESYSIGSLTSAGAQSGGIVGLQDTYPISNCYSKMNIAVAGATGGGICGINYGTGVFTNCYYAGILSVGTTPGGILGIKSGTATDSNSFWDTEVSGVSASAVGTGKTTAEMKLQETYTSWDFATPVWKIDCYNSGYPYLSFQGVGSVCAETSASTYECMSPSIDTGASGTPITIEPPNIVSVFSTDTSSIIAGTGTTIQSLTEESTYTHIEPTILILIDSTISSDPFNSTYENLTPEIKISTGTIINSVTNESTYEYINPSIYTDINLLMDTLEAIYNPSAPSISTTDNEHIVSDICTSTFESNTPDLYAELNMTLDLNPKIINDNWEDQDMDEWQAIDPARLSYVYINGHYVLRHYLGEL